MFKGIKLLRIFERDKIIENFLIWIKLLFDQMRVLRRYMYELKFLNTPRKKN